MGGAHKIEIRAIVAWMMAKMELGFFVALLLPSVLGGEGSSVSFLGHELLSSQLWGSATANLFLVKESECTTSLYVAAAHV